MSTSSAAQVDLEARKYVAPGRSHPPAPGTIAQLKLQTAERLAAHRAQRRRPFSHADGPELFEHQAVPQPQSDTRAMRIAAAVAERYAQSQSYRAFLAAEAERTAEQARAAAEAARTAEAVAVAQQQLLSDLENWASEDGDIPFAPAEEAHRGVAALMPVSALTVRLFEENTGAQRTAVNGIANAVPCETLNEEEREMLDQEIAFRQSPVFEELVEAAVPIAANLIEFPRQLVAARKARPRLAEGPLREEQDDADAGPQLRIFEVEADRISTVVDTESSLPEWSSIRLSAHAVAEAPAVPAYPVSAAPPVLAAPMALRLMAATVDGIIQLGGFLGFATIVAYTSGVVPTGATAAISSAVVLAVFFLVYQTLFFTLGEATPGMRYARIGLCTLGDDNPSRAAMRRRIPALLLAACPLGLGLLWAAVDEDSLGWHDRISRMYPRSY